MMTRRCLVMALLPVLAVVLMGGCARAARDTSGFALENTAELEMPFDEAWQLVKSVLREQELELYTRDKRGSFTAYTKKKRALGVFRPNRTQYTVDLAKITDDSTFVRVETIRQVYGVTLLTYPDWHDRKGTDASGAEAMLQEILARAKK
jgi:hypothetical protein